MPRAFLVVMDSAGCGGAPDAGAYFNDEVPDTGANTLGHIAAACAAGEAEEGRSGPLRMPHLDALGLGAAIRLASGARAEGLDAVPDGLWGAAQEVSVGKEAREREETVRDTVRRTEVDVEDTTGKAKPKR